MSHEKRLKSYRFHYDKWGNHTPENQIPLVNTYFNQKYTYTTDLLHYRVRDKWVSLPGFIKAGKGDCEEYAIAKFTTLKRLGIQDTWLVYCRKKEGSPAHLVCVSQGMVLDNATFHLSTLAERDDLLLLHTFNEENPKINQWINCLETHDIYAEI